eukprot:scaffold66649_cov48-Phaeocystis_antarctica.AAC.1
MLVILSAAHSAARTRSNLIGRSWTSFHVTWLRSTKVHPWTMSTARLAGDFRVPCPAWHPKINLAGTRDRVAPSGGE